MSRAMFVLVAALLPLALAAPIGLGVGTSGDLWSFDISSPPSAQAILSQKPFPLSSIGAATSTGCSILADGSKAFFAVGQKQVAVAAVNPLGAIAPNGTIDTPITVSFLSAGKVAAGSTRTFLAVCGSDGQSARVGVIDLAAVTPGSKPNVYYTDLDLSQAKKATQCLDVVYTFTGTTHYIVAAVQQPGSASYWLVSWKLLPTGQWGASSKGNTNQITDAAPSGLVAGFSNSRFLVYTALQPVVTAYRYEDLVSAGPFELGNGDTIYSLAFTGPTTVLSRFQQNGMLQMSLYPNEVDINTTVPFVINQRLGCARVGASCLFDQTVKPYHQHVPSTHDTAPAVTKYAYMGMLPGQLVMMDTTLPNLAYAPLLLPPAGKATTIQSVCLQQLPSTNAGAAQTSKKQSLPLRGGKH